jgi:hypothetical protein
MFRAQSGQIRVRRPGVTQFTCPYLQFLAQRFGQAYARGLRRRYAEAFGLPPCPRWTRCSGCIALRLHPWRTKRGSRKGAVQVDVDRDAMRQRHRFRQARSVPLFTILGGGIVGTPSCSRSGRVRRFISKQGR